MQWKFELLMKPPALPLTRRPGVGWRRFAMTPMGALR